MSTITEPGFIALTISSVTSTGAGAARDQRGGDDDVGQRDALGDLDLSGGRSQLGGIGRA